MKKVGIITSYLDFNKNYGGVLQAYALAKVVEELGYKPYIMPYIYEHIPDNNMSTIKKIKKTVYETLMPDRIGRKKQKAFRQHMLSFVYNELPMYRENRIRIAELEKISKEFYAFICGSDQVWSTVLQKDKCDAGMFLKFVSNPTLRIAYAPSMGSTNYVSEETASDIRESLSRFDAISIREKKGQQLLKSVIGKDVPLVLDPTLLLAPDCWKKIEKPVKQLPPKYMLVYRFGDIEFNYNCILDIQRYLDIPIIELPSSAVSMNDNLNKRFDIDPGEFINLVRNATLVCTDSFHATVFSIITSTPFVSFFRQDPSRSLNMNGRLIDLLSMTGLSDRLIGIGSEVDYSKLFQIDFDAAHGRIASLRHDSYLFLRNALKE